MQWQPSFSDKNHTIVVCRMYACEQFVPHLAVMPFRRLNKRVHASDAKSKMSPKSKTSIASFA